ncbi:LysE family translocator [Roseibium algae]|uniref:LysE family translocator n=1 Tax=Roseibium algae TaxID=3123038 RepID=A0ABU8TH64_9HYPH
MAIEAWLAFTMASIILTLIPGPSVLLVIGQAVAKGKKAAIICILGDVIGGLLLIGLSFMGVGALLATSAVLFQIVKWAGVFYLAYLGYRQIMDAKNGADFIVETQEESSSWASFWAGLITAVLNPKAIVFYMAFLSQFIDPDRSMALQLTIMAITSSFAVCIPLGGYALLAARARLMFQSRAAQKKVGYTGGACLIGGSVFMAATR